MSSAETEAPPTSHRYAQLTWPEVADWARRDPVCLIPVATLEDHGYHLPIDTDVVIAETLAEQSVLSRRANSLLLPTVTHGYTPHHMQFPGSITIDWKTFVDHLLDIGRSLVHHGFNRILFVNGHGSNVPLVEMAARLLMVEHPHSIAGGVLVPVGARVGQAAGGDARLAGTRGYRSRLRAGDVALPGDPPRAGTDGQGGA